ncbi:uncharacterized protein LOC128218044 isoform X1 [Mya arenaria]|uniref:uncharacterized protein LOC128217787 isoform X3 n=1 Tax=Mya arenaria TaxID=6604 RepID=UPI0022E16EA6|nr:uncharacterized protein LOC128217787 isoform X3 [Mya arenaria]XP_052781518.1 uncharacterized protein LOC128218044 isoform X1 [Mya arenaria]
MTDSYLVPRPRTTEMTFWSRYDPVAQPRRSTDHWTKMKQRAIQYRSLDNPDGIGAPMSMDRQNYARGGYGRTSELSDKTFDDLIADALQGAMPGSYMYTRPRNSVSRESTRSAFNQRARDGFRYWLIERPKPTSFWKYSFADPRLMPRARRFMPK